MDAAMSWTCAVAASVAMAACIATAACAAPAVGTAPARHPDAQPCTVDEKGNVTHTGGRPAMCCPDEYVAGGNSTTTCAPGLCCHYSEDMGTEPPVPGGPILGPVFGYGY